MLYERTHRDWDATLDRYLKPGDVGARPNSENAWELGETLRERFDVSWISGFWMLYAAGRFHDFVGVLRSYFYDLEKLPHYDDLMILGDLLACIEELAYATTVDHVPELAVMHRTIPPDTQQAGKLFEAISSRSPGSGDRPIIYDPRDLSDVDRYTNREDAKRRWCAFEAIRDDIAKAQQHWILDRGKSRGTLMLNGALAIARDSELTVFEREQLAMRVIESTLREGLLSDDGYEEYPFERPIEHPIDTHRRRFGYR